MKLTDIAKKMGSLGGKSRAKRLSSSTKQSIASLGGLARAQSILATKRIEQNFSYVAAMHELSGRLKKIKRVKVFRGKLPGIYPNEK